MTTTLTARSPEDVLAAVPVLLGFVPTESIAMLTLGAHRCFHARIDLPADARDRNLRLVARTLLQPVRRHGVRRVLLVVYTERREAARAAWRVLSTAFGRARVDVCDALWADGSRWYPLLRDDPADVGQAYDLATHAFTAQGVLEGRVVLGSREELAGTLRSRPEQVVEVSELVRQLPADDPDRLAWALRRTREAVDDGVRLGAADWARLLVGLRDRTLQHLLWASLTRARSREQVALWSDGVRRAPPELLAPPAVLLGYSAWLAGDGALAWCALDRWEEVGDESTSNRAALLGGLLAGGIQPSMWDQVIDDH